jgi:hypothetical protein
MSPAATREAASLSDPLIPPAIFDPPYSPSFPCAKPSENGWIIQSSMDHENQTLNSIKHDEL